MLAASSKVKLCQIIFIATSMQEYDLHSVSFTNHFHVPNKQKSNGLISQELVCISKRHNSWRAPFDDSSKDNEERMGVKRGALSKHPLAVSEIRVLSELPSLEVLRAQVFALFNTPAQQLVRVLNAVPQGVVNVLQAMVEKI
jgi:hypothetical protein